MRRSSPSADGTCGHRRYEHQSLFLGIALLLTLVCEVTPIGNGGALSTTITGSRDPTALQQLATFAAMRDEADEQNLDWGSFSSLSPKQRGYKPPTTPSGTTTPSTTESEHGDSSAHSATTETDSYQSSLSTTSRHRPHRRHRRGQKLSLSGTGDDSETDAGLSSTMELSSSVHTRRFWSQLHVMEVAYSTRDNNFIQITERFAEYERMYPIVYQCHIADVHSPAEVDLLASPKLGLDGSRFWTCSHCGKRHDLVREQCVRCRHPSHFTKLFVGQAVKEVNCAQSLIRLFHATHPHIAIHRIESHRCGPTDGDGGGGDTSASGRYKGCASVYVLNEHAAELVHLLNRNVFFDETSDGKLIAHYVYQTQQSWLHALAQTRTLSSAAPAAAVYPHGSDDTVAGAATPVTEPLSLALGPRTMHLPWAPLVVEHALSDTHATRRGGSGTRAPNTHAVVVPSPSVTVM